MGIRNKIKQFISDKASKEMENNSTNDIDNLKNAEDLNEISENSDTTEESLGSKLMSDVLEAVNAARSENAESAEVLDSENPASEQAESSEKDSQIEKLKLELAAAQDKYLRSLADFENFKKRSIKERSDMLKYQGEQIILDMVRVFDDLELAVQFSENDKDKAVDPQKFIEGLKMIHKNFTDTLARWEIKSESAVGKQFDPQKHMAISKVVLADSEPGTVVSELKKVYFYKDKILRVAEVIVAAPES